MFRINTKHTESNIFGFADKVSPKKAKEIQESEEMKFYDLIFYNIKKKTSHVCIQIQTAVITKEN